MRSLTKHATAVICTVCSLATWAQTDTPAPTLSIQDILNAGRDTQPKPLSAEELSKFLSERVAVKGSI